MKMLDSDSHPISLVPEWLEAVGEGWYASFSRYRYSPQTVEDERERFKVPLRDVTKSWLERQLEGLPSDYELAMDSVLTSGRRERHIPMVDFAAKVAQQNDVILWVSQHLGLTVRLFDSGRSFHAYGTEPVSRRQWVRLMGLLLLANMPDDPPLVDSRWVGHRLLAGYASLRWSQNSPRYLSTPTAVVSMLPSTKARRV